MNIVFGIAQVVSSLATIEIARPGLEATTYETLVTIHNCALAFNTNIANTFLPLFNLVVHCSSCGSSLPTKICVQNGKEMSVFIRALLQRFALGLQYAFSFTAHRSPSSRCSRPLG